MKKWLMERVLPVWAKQTLLEENRELYRQNHRLACKVRELESYIKGIHKGLGRK